jgi:hypothetical protein
MLGSTTNQKCITFGYLLHIWFRGIRVPICVFWSLSTFGQGCWRTMTLWIMSFHSWRLDGVRDMGSGDSTAVDVKTFLEAFLKNFWTLNYFLNCQSIMISGVSASRLKEFYCIYLNHTRWWKWKLFIPTACFGMFVPSSCRGRLKNVAV